MLSAVLIEGFFRHHQPKETVAPAATVTAHAEPTARLQIALVIVCVTVALVQVLPALWKKWLPFLAQKALCEKLGTKVDIGSLSINYSPRGSLVLHIEKVVVYSVHGVQWKHPHSVELHSLRLQLSGLCALVALVVGLKRTPEQGRAGALHLGWVHRDRVSAPGCWPPNAFAGT